MFNPNFLNTDLNGVSLAQLAQGFLDYSKFQFQETIVIPHSTNPSIFHIFLSPEGNPVAILIKDYLRSCGFNIILHFHQILETYPQIKQAIVISNHFSFPARSNAKKLNIKLLPRGDLVSICRINQIPIPVNENLAFSECSYP